MSKTSEQEAKEIVMQFIDLPLKMDNTLMIHIKNYSDRLNIPLWLVIQNILISDFAYKQARMMVEGAHPYRMLPEFIKEVLDDGTEQVMTGEALFSNLIEVYKKEMTTQKDNLAQLEKSRDNLLAKYLSTPQGKAEYEHDVTKAKAEWEAKRKQP